LRVEGKAAGIYISYSTGPGSIVHFPLGNFPLGVGSLRFSGGECIPPFLEAGMKLEE
jgi:hypothetical protein